MTVPNEIFDSLLSGYLDDVLTPDERARVEQMLSSDPEARRELDSLRELRQMLQTIDRADRPLAGKLARDGFSERVIDAAIECARSEGVAEDHPLLRTTEAPSYRREYSTRSRRLAIAVLSLAASGLIGAIVIRRAWTPNGMNTVAQQNTQDEINVASIVPIDMDPTASLAEMSTAAVASEVEPSANSTASIASSPAPKTSEIDQTQLQPNQETKPRLAAMSSRATPLPTKSALANTSPTINSPAAMPSTVAAVTSGPLLSVIVLDVHRTELGRAMNPVREALQFASIGAGDQQAVDGGIVNSITTAVRGLEAEQSLDAASSPVEIKGTVMYIEASGKRIDRFINALVTDREGIESVGMSLAMNAPLGNVVRSLPSPEAVTVRNDYVFEFSGELQGVSKELSRHLGNQRFTPWSSATVPTSQHGPDVNSRIFVLIR